MTSASIYIDKARYIWQHAGFQKYFRNTGWMFIGRIFGLLISFFTTIYVVRYLGPENYGVLSYAVSFVGLFSFIASFGIDQVLYRELIKYPDKRGLYLGTSFLIKLFFGIFAFLLTTISAFIVNKGEHLINISILIIAFSFIFQSFNIIQYYFQSKTQSKTINIIAIFVSSIIGILKISIILLNQGVIYLSLIILFESIINAVLLFIIFVREKSIKKWEFKLNTAKEMVLDSWPFLFAGAFSFIYSRIDQIMIQNIIDTKSVGIYDAAVRLTEAWYLIPNILAASLLPAILNSKSDKNAYFKRLKLFLFLMIIISTIIILFLSTTSKIIVNILYGSEFKETAIILSIYSFSLIGTFVGHLMNNYLLSENNGLMIFINSSSTMLVNILLNIIFIPKIGIIGAAIATVISYTLVSLIPLISKKVRNDFYMIIKAK